MINDDITTPLFKGLNIRILCNIMAVNVFKTNLCKLMVNGLVLFTVFIHFHVAPDRISGCGMSLSFNKIYDLLLGERSNINSHNEVPVSFNIPKT